METAAAALRAADCAGEGLASPSNSTSILAAAVTASEAARELRSYPALLQQTLPTRLGNILRRHEMLAGSVYGLDAILSVPRVGLLAPSPEVDYVEDQRMQLEMAVRTSFLGAVASAVTVVFMWWHTWWILLALGPYAVAYLAYRGATVVAVSYGIALGVLLELNRFVLYERLRLPLPQNTDMERRQNDELMRAFAQDWNGSLPYNHPPTTAVS
jgi:hypothetical protein